MTTQHHKPLTTLLYIGMLITPGASSAQAASVPAETALNAVFDITVTNNNPYSNKLNIDGNPVTDDLRATFTSPTGKVWRWWGFYDGDGLGAGTATTGNVWRIRFNPTEAGNWTYSYSWQDVAGFTTPAVQAGQFHVTDTLAGKGILQAYQGNKRWLAYGGTEPVFMKSFYAPAGSLMMMEPAWLMRNVFVPLKTAGYNNVQMDYPGNWLEQYWRNPADPGARPLSYQINGVPVYYYTDHAHPSAGVKFNQLQRMEQSLQNLSTLEMTVNLFAAFDGKDGGLRWNELAEPEKQWLVKYLLARFAPYSSIGIWTFSYETNGNNTAWMNATGEPEAGDATWSELMRTYDLFNHLRTYEDCGPASVENEKYAGFPLDFEDNNYYANNATDLSKSPPAPIASSYTAASVENYMAQYQSRYAPHNHTDVYSHQFSTAVVNKDRLRANYIPVYMMEGRGLWRFGWGATEDVVIDNIWAVTLGGGSFTWTDVIAADGFLTPVDATLILKAYPVAAKAVDNLTTIMQGDLQWFQLDSRPDLLKEVAVVNLTDLNNTVYAPPFPVTYTYLLAEPGRQYLAWSKRDSDNQFKIQMSTGTYQGFWMNTRTGVRAPAIAPFPIASAGELKEFVRPADSDSYILVLKSTSMAIAQVGLTDLAQIWDGTAKTATATTVPPGLTVVLTYNGLPAPPVDAGSYAVVATVSDSYYSGSARDTLVISGVFTLATTAVNGTVTGGGTYPAAATATLTASPQPGYVFTIWSGAASGSGNPLAVIMDASKSITATFAMDTSDADADGLSAYLEVVVYRTNPSLADTDGDAYLDGTEVEFRSNPLAGASHAGFAARVVADPAAGTVEFRFVSQPGKFYRVESSPDLVHWTSLETGIAGTGGTISRDFTIQSMPRRFFRAMSQ